MPPFFHPKKLNKMYIHFYIVYNTLREKDIIQVRSKHSAPCTSRDAEKINKKTIFSPIEVAFVGYVKTEEEETAGESTPADVSGSQRPQNNDIKTYITWT